MTKHKAWLKKLGMKELSINLGMIDQDVIVAIGKRESVQEYMRFKFECNNDFDAKDSYGRCYFSEGYAPIVWIPNYPRTPRQHGTLAHECIHASLFISRKIGIGIERNSEEFLAHAVSYLVTSILKTRSKV